MWQIKIFKLPSEALHSFISKTLEIIFIRKFLRLSLIFNHSDRQHGFNKEYSAGDLTFLSDSSLRCFVETFAAALYISKPLDWLWHKILLFKLIYGFSPLHYTFSFNFVSDWSLATVANGLSSLPMSCVVPQGSFLSVGFCLLSSTDKLSYADCPTQSYADNSILHFSASSTRRPSHQKLYNSRRYATKSLTSDSKS